MPPVISSSRNERVLLLRLGGFPSLFERHRSCIVKPAVGPVGVVVVAKCLQPHPRFCDRGEEIKIEALVGYRAVEALLLQDGEGSAVDVLILEKIVRPDVIWVLAAKSG